VCVNQIRSRGGLFALHAIRLPGGVGRRGHRRGWPDSA
jgi:hypothetical protein